MNEVVSHIFTLEHVLRMWLEFGLAIIIKLFCDHGRINWNDLMNDLKALKPSSQLPGDGLSRKYGTVEGRDQAADTKQMAQFTDNIFIATMVGFVFFASICAVIIFGG